LDVSTAPLLEGAAGEALDGQSDELRLDLTGLTFMDSFGARAIIHAHNTAELLGARLVILSPAHEVRRMLELMGLDRVMRIRD
jgi:anti-sigma B factor antagonist